VVTGDLSGAPGRVIVSPPGGLAGLGVLLDVGSIPVPGASPLETFTARFVLAGDTNADAVVDQADLDAILLGWGQDVLPAHLGSGDLDGSARVDQADLDRVLLNWGRSGIPSAAGTAIPEPTNLCLLAGCIVSSALLLPRGLSADYADLRRSKK
jgi:hypothetical protein